MIRFPAGSLAQLHAWVILSGMTAVLLLLSGWAQAEGRPARGTRALHNEKPRAPGLGHPVRPGDTLWRVARMYGVTVDDLRRANGLRGDSALRIGQLLRIPGTSSARDAQEPPSLAEIVLTPPPETHRLALLWPVDSPVVSRFGPRGNAWHGGVDIRGERGTPIRAAAPGMVVESGREKGYGNVIKIWHALDLMTVYAHNHENYVRVGDWVDRGQVIATIGSTGRTTAPHLHFEVRLAAKKYDPLFWLPDRELLEVAEASSPQRPTAIR